MIDDNIKNPKNVNADSVVQKTLKYIDDNGGPRLLWGIGLILGLQVVFFISWLGSMTQAREVALGAVETDVKIARSLATDDKIGERLETAIDTVQQFRGRVYEASTTGLMSADIEAFLQQSAEEVGLDRVQVTLNFEKTDDEKIVRFVADITAQEKETGVFPLYLAKILSAKQAYYISSINWQKSVRRVKLKVECVGRLVEAET